MAGGKHEARHAPRHSRPMLRVSLRNIAAHKLRLVLSVLAVVLGTAFVTGSLVFTSTLKSTFDGLLEQGTADLSAMIEPEDPRGAGVPFEVAERVLDLPGVEAATPGVSGTVVLFNADGTPYQSGGAPSEGLAWVDPEHSVGDSSWIVDGRAPAGDDEVVLPTTVLESAGLAIGDTAQVYTTGQGMLDVRIVGSYASDTDIGGYVGVGFSEDRARALFTDGENASDVSVRAEPGVSQEQVRDTIAAEFPDYTVSTGDEVRERLSEQLSTILDFVNYFFVAFGLIALLVGTFIIYNTFSMLVAQRLRELALLRAIGASRGQLTRSVMAEAAVTGLVGSAIGVVAGFGLAQLIFLVLEALDLGIPSGALSLTPMSVITPLVLGFVVTVFSAWAPARRAGRVAPVQGMRVGSVSTEAGGAWRTYVGVLAVVSGLALALIGTWHDTTRDGAITVGVGAAALIVGSFLVMPALAKPIAGGIGRVIGAPFGAVGKLAATNAGRNTRRTAATAFALTLGLTLVAAFGTLGATTKESVSGVIDQDINAELVIQGVASQGPPTPLPGGIQDRVASVDEVGDVAWLAFSFAQLAGEPQALAAAGGPLEEMIDATMVDGSLVPGPDSLVVSRTVARDRGWTVGASVPLVGPDGTESTLRVTGVYEDSQILGPFYTGMDVYERLVPENLRSTFIMLASAADGVGSDEVLTAVTDELTDIPIAMVQSKQQYIDAQTGGIDQLLSIIYALLGLALVIAVLGIVNTLALSVIERRTEIGMLRAVGMQRSQIRRTINLESTQIAVFGALIGAAVGVYLGWAFVTVLADSGLTETTIPWGSIVVVLASSAVVGVLASLWPAHRAAKTGPLEAIAD
ncbi:ABC transporter permease [Dietzia cinnamea]|uniref:Putative ABC transport system permease protein n=1 Tax=Dietzia cinnamea TaxID=321318 RepID=A0A177LE66_9ACTN|nr:FtsX-like permease family protein [Dietzia cinnamea]MCT2062818.1 FtsX-like permease family protein [Dietzia cinnamea]MCT2237595.1 FtsX-like permease family protein [Dietzia cinnamea]MCT2275217.1 FtsX-like permease family protein [Dietzia cinnamea]OAH63666.1 ABC transporter permease [Dietzia cinnamea]TCW18841.1 putative ABC transport system permease protein [Dietzia cinnamea]